MQTEQKTLLERAMDALPDPIREAYEAAPRKGSEAHEVLRLLVAMYLWSNGYGSISFEKCVNHNGVQNMCVDIYEDTLNLFVECERFPDKKAIADRQKAIKDVYSTAKFVLVNTRQDGLESFKAAGRCRRSLGCMPRRARIDTCGVG
ncbi:MAG: hypothetical protein QXN95_02940 [Candidatus Bathyarchaeia archaeon]